MKKEIKKPTFHPDVVEEMRIFEELLKKELATTIRLYNAKGWSPATSTNYSFKNV